MVTIRIDLDEQANFEVKPDDSPRGVHLILELSNERAMILWQTLEDRLEHEGLIWDDEEH